MLNAFISASPHIGIWESRLSLGITKQWLTIDSDGQQLKLNEPDLRVCCLIHLHCQKFPS